MHKDGLGVELQVGDYVVHGCVIDSTLHYDPRYVVALGKGGRVKVSKGSTAAGRGTYVSAHRCIKMPQLPKEGFCPLCGGGLALGNHDD